MGKIRNYTIIKRKNEIFSNSQQKSYDYTVIDRTPSKPYVHKGPVTYDILPNLIFTIFYTLCVWGLWELGCDEWPAFGILGWGSVLVSWIVTFYCFIKD